MHEFSKISGCTDCPLLEHSRENSIYCGLTDLAWMGSLGDERFFLIIGGKPCAAHAQKISDFSPRHQQNFATAILETSDIQDHERAFKSLEGEVRKLGQDRPNMRELVLIGTCPTEVNDIDLSLMTKRLNDKLAPEIMVSCFDGSGIHTIASQGEDGFIASEIGKATQSEDAKPLVVGSLCAESDKELNSYFESLQISDICRIPRRSVENQISVGKNTHFWMTQPYLSQSKSFLENLGSQYVPAPVPIGERGTTAWLWSIAQKFGVTRRHFDEVTLPVRDAARRCIEDQKEHLKGKTVLLLPSYGLEIPLARYLKLECGMDVVGLDDQNFTNELVSKDLERLGQLDVSIDASDFASCVKIARSLKANITVGDHDISRALSSEGFSTISALDLMMDQIHFYIGSKNLTLKFAQALQSKPNKNLAAAE